MGILFIIAIILAWPTFGLSIVAYVVFYIFNRAKTRMHYADTMRAQRAMAAGEGRAPSWAGNRSKNEQFIYAIQEFAMNNGVPQTFLTAVLHHEETFTSLVHYAGAMEREGASFEEQELAVSNKLIEMWSASPAAVKEASLNS